MIGRTPHWISVVVWIVARVWAIPTVGTMILMPAAACAFQFLRFPFRRTLLAITLNAFILPQQAIRIPLFRLWRCTGLIGTLLRC